MQVVKYRLKNPLLRPRRTRLEIPGWAGQAEPRADGSHEYAWHCVPFSEAAKAGIELFYPHETELHVTTRGGELLLTGDWGELPDPDLLWPPFRTFGTEYYTYQILIDLKVDEGFAVKTETASALLHRHHRHRADRGAGAAAALVADDVFHGVQGAARGADAYLPAGRAVHAGHHRAGRGEVRPGARCRRRRRPSANCSRAASIASRATLSADTQWTSSTNTVFDGTYRRILGAARSAAKGVTAPLDPGRG